MVLHIGAAMSESICQLNLCQFSCKSFQTPPVRGYTPMNQGPLFDDDPGIMSEVETASTGFRRGGKQRSSLPVVRTPSKTLERPLGQILLNKLWNFFCSKVLFFPSQVWYSCNTVRRQREHSCPMKSRPLIQ